MTKLDEAERNIIREWDAWARQRTGRSYCQGIKEVLHAAVAGRFQMATKPIPLSEVERVWSSDAYMPRVVFTIGEQRG